MIIELKAILSCQWQPWMALDAARRGVQAHVQKRVPIVWKRSMIITDVGVIITIKSQKSLISRSQTWRHLRPELGVRRTRVNIKFLVSTSHLRRDKRV